MRSWLSRHPSRNHLTSHAQAVSAPRRGRLLGGVALGALVGVLLAGCASGTASSGGGADATKTATAASHCASVAGFGAAGPLSAPSPDVPFPAATFGTLPPAVTAVIGLYTIAEIHACTEGTTGATIAAHFAAQLPAQGWASSPRFPHDGALQDACGSATCWTKDVAARFVSVDQVSDLGHGVVTYRVLVANPPAAPTCPPAPAGPPTLAYPAYLSGTDDVPLPPLSKLQFGEGMYSTFNSLFCSAGTAASIDTFFKAELPKLGWAPGSKVVSPDGCKQVIDGWVKGDRALSYTVADGPTAWSITYASKTITSCAP